MAEKQIWTNSRLKAYQDCPQKEAYRYRDCLVPTGAKKAALNIGTAIHKGLEMWSVESALEALEFDYPGSTEEANEQEIMRGTVAAMLEGYFAHYQPFEQVETEREFMMPIRHRTKRGIRNFTRIQLAGKIDGIATIDGRQWIVEYKTAGQVDKSYFDRLDVDSQITFYMMAARRLGYHPVGVLYRVIKKPSIRQRQNETVDAFIERLKWDYLNRPDFYFYEARLYRGQNDLDSFEESLWKEIHQAEKNASDGFLPRHSHACSNWGACPYLPLCADDAGADMMFEHREPNEELSL